MSTRINPPRAPLVDAKGFITSEWYRLLSGVSGATDAEFLTVVSNPGVKNARTLEVATGELTGTSTPGTYTLGLANTTVVPGVYGSASKLLTITIDAKGRATGVTEFVLNSDNVTEGATNLFFTQARTRVSVSGSGGITYNSGTGVFTLDTASSRNVDHSAVSIIAGTGLTGGGDFTATRTLSVNPAGTYGAPTGTVARAAFATYTAPIISLAPTQAEVQAIADALQIVSRTLGALITDLRTNGNLS